MRRRLAFLVLLAISLPTGSHNAHAAFGNNCGDVICGSYCITHNVEWGGYCNFPAPDTSGCVQLYGPGCASMESGCCKPVQGASSF